jgi:lipopolysaccharide/colanic/teichoic acid biosynthesis glycosyltransferase
VLVSKTQAANTAQTIESCNAGIYKRYGKRIFDVVLSTPTLILLFPLGLFIAILVKLSSQGPVFYLQDRVGKDGKIFPIVKFRSMKAHNKGFEITVGGDSRITAVGKGLRKLKLDELPQLWNVFKGDMSLVGPRPEVPSYVSNYSIEQRGVLAVRPGITDLASIHYRREEALLAQSKDPEQFYRQEVLPHKLSLNLQYLKNMSFIYDIRLIAQTVWLLFSNS